MKGSKSGYIIAFVLLAFIVFIFVFGEFLLGPMFDRMYLVVGNDTVLPYVEPDINITYPSVAGNISFLEHESFRGVNAERTKAGVRVLKWNNELAYVARLYSQDMVKRNFFAHESPEGTTHNDRMYAQGVYYHNKSGENLAKINYELSYVYNPITGIILNRTLRTIKEVADVSVIEWMNSTKHREALLIPEFDESGIGVAYNNETGSFYFTQLFITRIHCGYQDASCCRDGNYVSCYMPWNCEDMICE